MPKLINISNNLPEEVPEENIGHAFLSGTHDIPAGQRVNLVDSNGEMQSVDASEVVPSITKGGFKFPTSSQLNEARLNAKYGEGPGNAAAAFVAGMGRGATFGASDVLAPAMGLTTQEALRERRKRFPGTSMAGELTGVGASLALAPELSPAGVVSGLGTGIEGAIGDTLAAKALASGAEGAIYGAGNVLSDAALGDPNLTGQRIAAEIGLGGILGGTLGAGFGLAGKGFTAARELFPKIGQEAAEEAAPKVGETMAGIQSDMTAAGLKPEPGDLLGSMDQLNYSESDKKSVFDGLTKLKKNADEIQEAAERLGAPAPEGMLSDSNFVQKLDSSLTKNPSVIGIKRDQLYRQGFNAVENAVDGALATSTNMTENEAGHVIQDGLTSELRKEYEPIQEMYNSIKERTQTIPIRPGTRTRAANSIMEIEGIADSPSSPQYQLAKSVSEELKNLEDVDAIKRYKKILSERAYGQPQLKRVTGIIQDKLSQLEESSIISHGKNLLDSDESARLINAIGEAKATYKTFREKLNDIGELTGKRKVYGPEDLLTHIENMTPEKLTNKLFDKKNADSLKFFQENFPEQMKILTDLQKNKIRQAPGVFKDGRILPNGVIRQVDKLSPEAKKIIFSEGDLQKLTDAKTWMQAVPKDINPSGTDQASAMTRFFEGPLSAAAITASDYGKLKLIETLAAKHGGADAAKIQTLIKLEKTALQSAKRVADGVNTIFKAGENIAPFIGAKIAQQTQSEKDESKEKTIRTFEKRRKQLELMASNPDVLIDRLGKATQGISEHAPNVAQSIQATTSRGVQFLQSKLPKLQKAAPMAPEPEPTEAQIAEFNKYMTVVQRPLSVLDQIKNGTLSQHSVEAISTVHPDLYQSIKSEIFDKITDNKVELPYRTKAMLSMFTGQPLVASLIPQNVLANQMSYAMPSAQNPDGMAAPRKPTQKGLEKLSLADRLLTPMQRSSERGGE